MAARGRKSAASLSIARVVPGLRPEPPESLTQEQAEVWRAVVATKPADWFQADSHPLLVQFCRHTVAAGVLAEQIDRFDPAWLTDDEHLKRYEKLLSMREKESRAINALARAMRLTQQSRYDAKVANTADQSVTGASGKPWEFAAELN